MWVHIRWHPLRISVGQRVQWQLGFGPGVQISKVIPGSGHWSAATVCACACASVRLLAGVPLRGHGTLGSH